VQIAELESALDRMSYAELKAIVPMVSMRITEREKAEHDAVKAELKALAKSKGVEFEELFGSGAKPVKEKKTVPPKYRNPADATQTWTGRGRKPGWIEPRRVCRRLICLSPTRRSWSRQAARRSWLQPLLVGYSRSNRAGDDC